MINNEDNTNVWKWSSNEEKEPSNLKNQGKGIEPRAYEKLDPALRFQPNAAWQFRLNA